LRAVYALKADDILRGLLQMLGLVTIMVEQKQAIAQALKFYRQDMDFAKVLHLLSKLYLLRFTAIKLRIPTLTKGEGKSLNLMAVNPPYVDWLRV
jgi:hypothetical protein